MKTRYEATDGGMTVNRDVWEIFDYVLVSVVVAVPVAIISFSIYLWIL